MNAVTDYTTAQDFFSKARNPEAGRPLQNNTRLYEYPSPDDARHTYAVCLHATDVVTYLPNGNVVLSSGGWRTVTTKDRITTYAPVRVSSVDGIWEVSPEPDMSDTPEPQYARSDDFRTDEYPYGYDNPEYRATNERYKVSNEVYMHRLRERREKLGTIPFFDGMEITPEGKCLNGPNGETWAAYKKFVKKTKKQISLYVKAYLRHVNKTGAAGCFDTDDDRFMFMQVGDASVSDLLDMVQNKRYPIDLAVHYLREDGYGSGAFPIFLGMDQYGGPSVPWRPVDEARNSPVGRSLYKHLTRKLVPEPPSDDTLSFLQMEIAR